MLYSFSYMHEIGDVTLFYEAEKVIESKKYWFMYYGKGRYEELMRETLMYILDCYNPYMSSLSTYVNATISKLAMKRSRYLPFDPLDFFERLGTDTEEYDTDNNGNSGGRFIPKNDDFSDEIYNNMYQECGALEEVMTIAIKSIDEFVNLCKSYRTDNYDVTPFSDSFMRTCRDALYRCENFHNLCLEVFEMFKESIFTFQKPCEAKFDWEEANFIMLRSKVSEKFYLVDKNTGVSVSSPDNIDSVTLNSNNNGVRRIFYVDMSSVMEELGDKYYDWVSNSLKLYIGDHYLLRTIGGSVSVVDVDIKSYLRTARDEILTNILRKNGVRLLGENENGVFLISSATYDISVPRQTVNGIDLNLKYIDITDKVVNKN